MPDTDQLYYAALLEDDDGQPYFVAPLHPNGIGGGKVQLSVVADTVRCAPVDFQVKALAAAPGYTRKIAERFQKLVDHEAQYYGFSRAELIEALDPENETFDTSLPVDVWPLVYIQSMLDHPGVPSTFVSFLKDDDVAASDAAEHKVQMDMLDAYLSRLEMVPLLDAYIADLQALPQVEHKWGVDTGGPGQIGAPYSGLVITDAAQLSHYVLRAAVHCHIIEDSHYFQHAIRGVGILSVGHVAVKAFAAGFVNAGVLLTEISRLQCALLPSIIHRFTIIPATLDIEEDGTDDSIFFSSLQVTARNSGWDFTETGKNILAAAISQAFSALPRQEMAVFQEILENGLLDVYLSLVKGILPSGQPIGTRTWPAINVDDTEWTAFFPDDRSEGVFVACPSSGVPWGRVCLRGAKVGREVFRLALNPYKFPAKGETARDVVGAVSPITIKLSPPVKLVDVGARVAIAFEVSNAQDGRLEWEMRSANGVVQPAGTTSDLKGTKEVVLPADEEEFPVTIAAKSTSRWGLRALPDAPSREGRALMRLGDFELEWEERCLRPGEQVQFTALTREPTAVNFSADGGQISAAGLYTAPAEAGTYTVTASATIGARLVEKSASVIVGACDCWFSLQMVGNYNASIFQEYGITPLYQFPIADTLVIKLQDSKRPGGPTQTEVLFSAHALNGLPGRFRGSCNIGKPLFEGGTTLGVDFEITELTDTHVAGHTSCLAVKHEGPDQFTTLIRMQFRTIHTPNTKCIYPLP
ncbi:MAG: hypothetical protein H0U74_07725 [Bradymonadaceae bacterium]|nr:hypothetical protein [Lujinxingiaceae bacterium]